MAKIPRIFRTADLKRAGQATNIDTDRAAGAEKHRECRELLDRIPDI